MNPDNNFQNNFSMFPMFPSPLMSFQQEQPSSSSTASMVVGLGEDSNHHSMMDGGNLNNLVQGFPNTFLELLNFANIPMGLGAVDSINDESEAGRMNNIVVPFNSHHQEDDHNILLGKTNSETILFSTSPNNENSSDSSNNSKSNSETLQSVEELSAIACDHCRSQHRKCDKRKPSCYSCQQRGIDCHYRESKRNLKKKPNIQPPSIVQKKRSDPSFEPYVTSKSKTTATNKKTSEPTALTSSLSKPNMIDFYYDVVSGGYPLISRQELELFTLKFDENRDINTMVDFEMPSLYFSIKALCECQYGLHEQAEKSAENAKKCLSRVFDKFSSFMVAGAYVQLIMFELWTGRFENCKFYLQILTFFEKKLFPPDCEVDFMTEYQQNLQGWIFYFDRIIFIDNKDLKDITVEDILKRLPSIFEFLHRKPFPNEWVKSLNTEITAENCFEIWSLVEMILNQSKTIERSNITSSESSKFYLEIIELVYQFILDGARICILSKSPQKDSSHIISGMIDQSAAQITSLTENPWFSVFPLELTAFLNAAASVHLEKVKALLHTGSFVHNNTDYLTLLRKDLRAFNVMRSKYKAASSQPSEVCLEIEKFLHEIDSTFVAMPPILESPHSDLHTRLEEFLDEFLPDQ